MKKRMSACVALAIMALLCVGCPISISRYSYEGWLWNESRLGDEYEGTDIWQLSDGGYLLLARHFGQDDFAFIMRLSPTGEETWHAELRDVTGVPMESIPPRMAVLADESVLVAGMNRPEETFDRTLHVINLDTAGETVWTNRYEEFDFGLRLSVCLSASSNVLLGSVVKPNSNGAMEITEGGTKLWMTQFARDFGSDVSANAIEKFGFEGIGASSTGRAIMCGKYVAAGSPALLKIDSDGEVAWFHAYAEFYGAATQVQETADGSYVVGAEFDVYVEAEERSYHPAGAFKVDADGNLVWKREHLTPHLADADEGHVHDMEIDQAGNIIIVGELEFNGPTNPFGGTPVTRLPYICKLSGDGDLIWFKTMENPGHINGVGIKNDGGYVTAGMTGDAQLQVIHFDTNGNIVDVP